MGHQTGQQHQVTEVQSQAGEGCAGESVPAQLDDSEEEEPDLDREGGGPCQVVKGVVIPDIELVVQAPGEHHSDKVAHEERQD